MIGGARAGGGFTRLSACGHACYLSANVCAYAGKRVSSYACGGDTPPPLPHNVRDRSRVPRCSDQMPLSKRKLGGEATGGTGRSHQPHALGDRGRSLSSKGPKRLSVPRPLSPVPCLRRSQTLRTNPACLLACFAFSLSSLRAVSPQKACALLRSLCKRPPSLIRAWRRTAAWRRQLGVTGLVVSHDRSCPPKLQGETAARPRITLRPPSQGGGRGREGWLRFAREAFQNAVVGVSRAGQQRAQRRGGAWIAAGDSGVGRSGVPSVPRASRGSGVLCFGGNLGCKHVRIK
ncbi:hypothetical protein CALVIDRAFT_279099 [Calocera viscosa TUFC12733]|uniref:Uncharacterized protein n=1 Tax=Calocera viscosa (strain TUFC12733) TaxID=1330018 RepID=A0A167R3S4_CALVF|nr:hypothetical protein CALVIDRAFT_279099 [Calocera viscosa TUFC12733]